MTDPKRRSIRFPPEFGTFVQIDLRSDGTEFNPTIAGMVLNESAKGCGAVVVKTLKLQEGQKVKAAVGKLSPLLAEIKWVQELDSQVLKIGLQYLE